VALLWAVDVVIITESPEKLARAFAIVDEWCKDWLMDVNALKSNVMVVGNNPDVDFAALLEHVKTQPFMLGGGIVLPAKSYKYLGIQFTYNLRWDTAANVRLDAVRKAIFANSKILHNGDISFDIRLKFFEAVIMPKAMWGSELWADTLSVCKKMEKVLGTALRMITFVPPRASKVALGFELGYIPFHIRVAARRLRILQKWKAINPTEEKSGVWAHRILASNDNLSGKSWSWIRQTKHKAIFWLKASGNGLDTSKVKTSLNEHTLQVSASLVYYRDWCNAKKTGARELLLLLHKHDKIIAPASYLKAPKASKCARALILARIGALMFNRQARKFVPGLAGYCPFDTCMETSQIEDLPHFLFDCSSYQSDRDSLAQAWGIPVEQLFQRGSTNWWLALGESPQSDDPTDPHLCEVTRIVTFQDMWRKRCVANAPRNSPVRVITPGVEAR